VDNIAFTDLTPFAFAPTLSHAATLSVGEKRFENYHDGSPYFTSFDTGELTLRFFSILFL
jgi:hypothetical protein